MSSKGKRHDEERKWGDTTMLLIPDNLLTATSADDQQPDRLKEASTHGAPSSASFTLDQVAQLRQFLLHPAPGPSSSSSSDPNPIIAHSRIRLIFWSNRDPLTHKMWCPDCEDMQVNLANVLQYHALDAISAPGSSNNTTNNNDQSSSPFLVYVYVGDRDQWKSADNPFRQAPWNISRIPTVLKLQGPAAATAANTEIIVDHQDKLVEKDAIDFKKLLDFLS